MAHETRFAAEELLASLNGARRVLVVAHTAPDGDGVVSALGLGRALKLLGKEADVCVDGALPGALKKLDSDGEVKRASELPDATYDLVVLVDVAEAHRIGDARRFLAGAREVAVIDHHDLQPSREKLGLVPEGLFVAYNDASADANALLVAGVSARLLAGKPKAARARVDEALLAGALSDTHFSTTPGTSLDALRLFKHLLAESGFGLDEVLGRLAFRFPASAGEALVSLSGGLGLPGRAAEVVGADGSRTLLLSVPEEAVEAALEAGRRDVPETTDIDLRSFALDRLEPALADHDAAVLLFEYGGRVTVSARSREAGPALALAQALGGGGHARAAGVTTTRPLAEVETQVRAALAAAPSARAVP